MGQIYGADPDQLEGLGDQFSRSADRLEGIRSEITALLRYSPWEGRDADHFRDLWQRHLAAVLDQAATTTREGATRLRTNAWQQREASAHTDGYGGSAFGGSGGARGHDPFGDAADLISRVMMAGSMFSLPFAVLAEFKDSKLVKGLSTDFRKLFIDDAHRALGELAPKLGTGGLKALEFLGKGPGALAILDVLVSGGALVHDFDINDPRTLNEGVGMYFAVASAATFWCPPASLILGGIGLAYGIAAEFNPNLTQDLVDGLDRAAQGAWDGVSTGVQLLGTGVDRARDAVSDAVSGAVLDAAETTRDVMSGGVNAARRLFGW